MSRNLSALWLLTLAQCAFSADEPVQECVMVLALDGSLDYVSDAAECSVATSPASTYKLPHALIALGAGAVADPLATVRWDGTDYPNALWEQDHSMDSAIKWSALWFFQRVAGLIGRERMLEGLAELEYASDSYEGEQTQFWLNGDLVVTPREQLRFLTRLSRNELPVAAQHVNALNAAFLMPDGKVTLASGEHDFILRWPKLGAVHAKTGNARVGDESVSWIVGYFDADARRYVFVARARSNARLPGTTGVDLAQRVLNTQAGLPQRK